MSSTFCGRGARPRCINAAARFRGDRVTSQISSSPLTTIRTAARVGTFEYVVVVERGTGCRIFVGLRSRLFGRCVGLRYLFTLPRCVNLDGPLCRLSVGLLLDERIPIGQWEEKNEPLWALR